MGELFDLWNPRTELRLMMAPPAVVDYVELHEIAHLVEPNHNDEFRELVAS